MKLRGEDISDVKGGLSTQGPLGILIYLQSTDLGSAQALRFELKDLSLKHSNFIAFQ